MSDILRFAKPLVEGVPNVFSVVWSFHGLNTWTHLSLTTLIRVTANIFPSILEMRKLELKRGRDLLLGIWTLVFLTPSSSILSRNVLLTITCSPSPGAGGSFGPGRERFWPSSPGSLPASCVIAWGQVGDSDWPCHLPIINQEGNKHPVHSLWLPLSKPPGGPLTLGLSRRDLASGIQWEYWI